MKKTLTYHEDYYYNKRKQDEFPNADRSLTYNFIHFYPFSFEHFFVTHHEIKQTPEPLIN